MKEIIRNRHVNAKVGRFTQRRRDRRVHECATAVGVIAITVLHRVRESRSERGWTEPRAGLERRSQKTVGARHLLSGCKVALEIRNG
ncbi:MAG: hypothetical protein ABI556_04275, partial [Gemmatimonadales bacterium]